MVDAPEKIFADRGPRGGLLYREQKMPDTIAEYTRSDLVAELAAENERLKREVENWKNRASDWQNIANAEGEALANAGASKLRNLEWVDTDEGMCTKWRAAALGGHYELVDFGKDDQGFAVNFHWGRPLSFWFIQADPDEWGPTGPKIFPTLDEAKAAAQADYESRVLSELARSEAPTSNKATGEEK